MIDANMYYIPEQIFTDRELGRHFIDEIPQQSGWYGYMQEIAEKGKKQIVLEKPKGNQNLNYIQGDYQLEKMLRDMDTAGVQQAVLKVPGCLEWMSLSMCRVFNEATADYVRKSERRFIPLAVIPPYGTQESLAELEHCISDLGMKGVQCSAHYGEDYLDSQKFTRFFEKINAEKLTVYVHHTPIPVEYGSFTDYNNMRRSYGRIVDQGLAVGRELFSGFFTKYPDIRMVHSMLGGAFFAVSNMMFPRKAKQAETISRFVTDNVNVEEQFRTNMYFEMSHAQPWGKEQLECAIKIYGADHVIWGTSYPVRKEWLTGGPDFIRKLNISEVDKDKILGENARRLYCGK